MFIGLIPISLGQIMPNPARKTTIHRLFGQHRKAFGQLLHLPASFSNLTGIKLVCSFFRTKMAVLIPANNKLPSLGNP